MEAVGLGPGIGAVEGRDSSGVRERVQLMSAGALRQVAAQGQEAVEQVRQVLLAKPCRLHIQVRMAPSSAAHVQSGTVGTCQIGALLPVHAGLYTVQLHAHG